MADVDITGPARQLSRVRERGAELIRAEGIFGSEGPAAAVRVTFRFADNEERLQITLDRPAWQELCDRVARACVFE